MQVAPLNAPTAAAPANAAEETGSRAEQFARVLKNAFFGTGSKAVARNAEQGGPEPAQRSETRSHELRSNEVRASERRDAQAAENRDARQSAVAPTKPAEKTTQAVTAKQAEKPANSSASGTSTDTPAPTDGVAAESEAADVADASDQSAPSEAEDEVASESTPAVTDMAASDLLLILSLLQTDVPASPEVSQIAATETPALTTLVPVQPEGTAVEGQIPLVVAPAAALPVTEAPPVPVAADTKMAATVPVAPVAATPVLPEAAVQPVVVPDAEAAMAMAKATETSAAALLMQQQDVSPQDFAAIQQALVMQGQAKPAANAGSQAPAEGKVNEGKSLAVEIQSAPSSAASKTLVDQSALLAMQGATDTTQDAALQQLQPQAQPAADAKFAAVLQAQAEPAVPQANAAAGQSNTPPHLSQQASPLANPGTPAPQAAQQAASHAAARQLGAYIPAGEQVAVQIKKGAAEGLDKISIRLDPGNLGKVDIKMEVGHDGRLTAVIAADKPETLAMLQRDVQNLEQSLRDAGLKTSSDSLSFSLRDQNQAADGREGRDGQAGNGRNRGRGHEEYAGTGNTTDPAALAAANAQRAATARGGLDIRI